MFRKHKHNTHTYTSNLIRSVKRTERWEKLQKKDRKGNREKFPTRFKKIHPSIFYLLRMTSAPISAINEQGHTRGYTAFSSKFIALYYSYSKLPPVLRFKPPLQVLLTNYFCKLHDQSSSSSLVESFVFAVLE